MDVGPTATGFEWALEDLGVALGVVPHPAPMPLAGAIAPTGWHDVVIEEELPPSDPSEDAEGEEEVAPSLLEGDENPS